MENVETPDMAMWMEEAFYAGSLPLKLEIDIEVARQWVSERVKIFGRQK